MGKKTLLMGFAAGAFAAYFLDPEQGSGRRRRFGDQVRRAREKLSDEHGHFAPRDLISRTRDAAADAGSRLRNGHRDEIIGEARGTVQEMASMGRWSPRARIVAAGLGGALAFYGLRRTSLPGLALTALGTGLIARAVTNFEIQRGSGKRDDAGGAFGTTRDSGSPRRSVRASSPEREATAGQEDIPNAADLRDRAAEEEMTAFTENPESIPSD